MKLVGPYYLQRDKENVDLGITFDFPRGLLIEKWEESILKIHNIYLNDRNEYPIYTFTDFSADVGGLVGMLLGVSILSFYNFLAEMIVKCLRL